jgi:hypothetical protein
MEIYGVPSTASVAVTLEVTPADTRPAVVTVPAIVKPASDAAGARVVIGVIPIASLPPGDFLVRALVSVDGTAVGRAVRTLRKDVR